MLIRRNYFHKKPLFFDFSYAPIHYLYDVAYRKQWILLQPCFEFFFFASYSTPAMCVGSFFCFFAIKSWWPLAITTDQSWNPGGRSPWPQRTSSKTHYEVPWPWPRSLKSSKIAPSSARGQHYFFEQLKISLEKRRKTSRKNLPTPFFVFPHLEDKHRQGEGGRGPSPN